MNLVITAGGTRERIDTVRTIANEATGRLGSLIAREFANRLAGNEYTIYYICGRNSAVPSLPDSRLCVIPIESAEELQDRLNRVLQAQKIDAVVHSMAVSDYRVAAAASLGRISEALAGRLAACSGPSSAGGLEAMLLESLTETAADADGKISSDLEHPVLLLEKTPKVIASVKRLSPKTLLVGFKLLSGVGERALIETALGLLRRNGCDYVLANDTDSLQRGEQEGYLVDPTGAYRKYTGKEQIATGIAESVLTGLRGAER